MSRRGSLGKGSCNIFTAFNCNCDARGEGAKLAALQAVLLHVQGMGGSSRAAAGAGKTGLHRTSWPQWLSNKKAAFRSCNKSFYGSQMQSYPYCTRVCCLFVTIQEGVAPVRRVVPDAYICNGALGGSTVA